MRVYAIPIIKNKVAYHCVPIKKGPTDAGFVAKSVEKFQAKWAELSTAPNSSFKFKIYKWGMGVMDNIDYREWFLKGVPPKPKEENTKLLILHPSTLEPSLIKKDLALLLEERVPFHRRQFFLNALALPLTSVLTLLPLPNVPFFFILFRAYSHHTAYHGGLHLKELFNSNQVTFGKCDTLDRHILNSHNLGSVENKSNSDKVFLAWLARDLHQPEMEVTLNRALKQLSKIK